MFYGRENQKKTLLNMIKKEEQMISLIYGRRRIGKSELIKQSLKETDVKSIYYEFNENYLAFLQRGDILPSQNELLINKTQSVLKIFVNRLMAIL